METTIETQLVSAVENALSDLDAIEIGTPEYKSACESIQKLIEARQKLLLDASEIEKISEELVMKKAVPKISYEAILAGAINIIGILLVINHEGINVITTKALTLVGKSRL